MFCRIGVYFLLMAGFFMGIQGNTAAATARAEIRGTALQPDLKGEATFTEQDGKMQINVQIQGAPEGSHGFHIHEGSSCDENGQAAGGHWNPDNTPHGSVVENGFAKAHPGDFANIEVDEKGMGTKQLAVDKLTMAGEGKYNILGHAVIIHANGDNFEQPTGNAGGRIGCGVIQRTDAKEG